MTEWRRPANSGSLFTCVYGQFARTESHVPHTAAQEERGAVLMAVPKRKMSRSNTRSRRSQWKAELTELQTVRVRGREVRIPRKLAKAYQAGLLSD